MQSLTEQQHGAQQLQQYQQQEIHRLRHELAELQADHDRERHSLQQWGTGLDAAWQSAERLLSCLASLESAQIVAKAKESMSRAQSSLVHEQCKVLLSVSSSSSSSSSSTAAEMVVAVVVLAAVTVGLAAQQRRRQQQQQYLHQKPLWQWQWQWQW